MEELKEIVIRREEYDSATLAANSCSGGGSCQNCGGGHCGKCGGGKCS